MLILGEETPAPIVGFVADEPEFASLRPDLRDALRQQERELREGMAEEIAKFPDHWAAALSPLIGIAAPHRFIRSLLPFLVSVSEAMDLVELHKKHLLHAQAQGRRPS